MLIALGGRGTLLLLVLAGAIVLGACGGGEDSEADKIRSALNKTVTNKDPSVCSGASESVIAQASFGSDYLAKDNLRFCRENIATLLPDSIDVLSVNVRGDTGEARFKVNGGGLAFDVATIELRKADGRWRTQRIKAMTLNRARFERLNELQATTGADAVSPKEARCYVRALRASSDDEIERALVAADPGLLLDPILRCGFEPALRKQGLPRARIDCLLERLRRRSRTRVVQILIGQGAAAEARTDRLITRVISECD